jgi:hypothetical protein
LHFGLLNFSIPPMENNFKPYFWEELEQLLGPILQPIVHPIFMALDNESFRLTLLTTTITFFLIAAGLTWVLFEGIPLLTNLTEVAEELPDMDARRGRPHSTAAYQRHQTVPHGRDTEPKREARPEPSITQTGVRVISELSKERETVILTVKVENTTDSKIEMVVVDIDLPAGIDSDIGSFRMQRLGTIDSGSSEAAEFRLRQYGGNLTKIGGFIEFMSASYEVSKIDLPTPKFVEQ